MCLKLLLLLYKEWDLRNMQASPLKQAILSLCFEILSTISSLISTQKNKTKKVQLMIDGALELLSNMEQELNDLFEQEVNGTVTQYFQLLIDFAVLADNLRSDEVKMIKKFN